MKRLAAAAFSLGATAAAAQFSEVPPQKCDPKPQYPGLKAMRSEVEVKAFEESMRAYKECIMAYITQRKASAKAHDEAAAAAVDEHNRVMARIRADQEAARAEAEKAQ